MKIFLSGRCDTNWRDDVLGTRLSSLPLSGWDLMREPWPAQPGLIRGRHDYMGAYPVGLGKDIHGIKSAVFNHVPVRSYGNEPGMFVRHNLAAIDACDVLFAWIDRDGLYGTVAEIMYAHARRKTIWLAFPIQELVTTDVFEVQYWFIAQLATAVEQYASPAQAFDDFLTAAELRTMPYADYLKTDHWQRMRQEALARCGHKCMVCGARAGLEVHHNTYERRGHELPQDLIVLCRTCHQTFHDAGRLAR